jgi:hypothetical protein
VKHRGIPCSQLSAEELLVGDQETQTVLVGVSSRGWHRVCGETTTEKHYTVKEVAELWGVATTPYVVSSVSANPPSRVSSGSITPASCYAFPPHSWVCLRGMLARTPLAVPVKGRKRKNGSGDRWN